MGGSPQRMMQAISSLMGSSQTQQTAQGQPPPQSPSMMGAGQPSNSSVQQQTLSGGPTFAPDADGNLQIVPAGVQGTSAYMNQAANQASGMSPATQTAYQMANGMLGGLPPAPSQQTMQTMMQNPQFIKALVSTLGGTYGGGSP